MTHKVAFLDVMDAKVQHEIRSQVPPGFSIQFGEAGDRREQMAMVADADFILTAVAVDAEMIKCGAETEAAAQMGYRRRQVRSRRSAGRPHPVAITAGANAGAVSEHTRDADARHLPPALRWPIASCAMVFGSGRKFVARRISCPARPSASWASAMSAAWSRIASPVST